MDNTAHSLYGGVIIFARYFISIFYNTVDSDIQQISTSQHFLTQTYMMLISGMQHCIQLMLTEGKGLTITRPSASIVKIIYKIMLCMIAIKLRRS